MLLSGDGRQACVIHVLKKNAKAAKMALAASSMLNKNFRMVPSDFDQDCIAIPVNDDFNELGSNLLPCTIESVGTQVCPFSSLMLGNYRRKLIVLENDNQNGVLKTFTSGQQALFQTINQLSSIEDKNEHLITKVQLLNSTVCPKKLETFGDDRTLLLAPGAFEGPEFDCLLTEWNIDISKFWSHLALCQNSKRIARRGTVDPNSKIRQSGHRLVWPYSGIPETTGQGSPGWIQVTEQGIRQSLDLCRVMFSRGNISEKIRFGKLVQESDIVLDMYAGIGYYTLPAVIKGKAAHVYACEWNEHAANALKFNIRDNHIQDQVTVFVGDCRVSAQSHSLVSIFDRISLGLLPSSEGGWRTAIRGLKDCGGWLHIHANVPISEIKDWVLWTCSQLVSLASEEHRPEDWIALCHHVEKVKSFAPTVAHYVADVYVGSRPMANELLESLELEVKQLFKAGAFLDGSFVPCPESIQPPSCALSDDGVLNQEWMR